MWHPERKKKSVGEEEKHVPRISGVKHPGGLNAGIWYKVRRIQNKTQLQGKGDEAEAQALPSTPAKRKWSRWRLQLRAMRLKIWKKSKGNKVHNNDVSLDRRHQGWWACEFPKGQSWVLMWSMQMMLVTPGRQTSTHTYYCFSIEGFQKFPWRLQEWQEWERSGSEGEWEGYRYRKVKAGVEQSTWQKKKFKRGWATSSETTQAGWTLAWSQIDMLIRHCYLLSKNQRF